jgi:FAD/FMN-containing dehydrogenase
VTSRPLAERPSGWLDSGDLDALAVDLGAVERNGLIVDPDIMASYEQDATGRFSGRASMVALPGDTSACVGVLSACARHGAHVVPQGGNTGLVGGGVPRGGEVVLSTRRLAGVEEVDEVSMQMTAGAGTTLEEAQGVARSRGLELTIDHGARSAATLGGMAATDAGGAMALRHGTMRHHVVGLEAVTAQGQVLSRLSGMLKDNAGYRWPDLLVGSEGTLAVITRLRLALSPAPAQRASALFALPSLAGAQALLAALRTGASSLRAADFLTGEALELVCAHRGVEAPFREGSPMYVIVECAGAGDVVEELAGAASDESLYRDVAVADDSAGQERLWAYREAVNEAVRAQGVPHKLDVSVPLSALGAFARDLEVLLAEGWPMARLVLFGHLGDGNLHVNVLGLDPEDWSADEAILRLVACHGGSISAEHGVGVAKVGHLGLVRSPEELALMSSLKRAFDPEWLLNPGCVLPVP